MTFSFLRQLDAVIAFTCICHTSKHIYLQIKRFVGVTQIGVQAETACLQNLCHLFIQSCLIALLETRGQTIKTTNWFVSTDVNGAVFLFTLATGLKLPYCRFFFLRQYLIIFPFGQMRGISEFRWVLPLNLANHVEKLCMYASLLPFAPFLLWWDEIAPMN